MPEVTLPALIKLTSKINFRSVICVGKLIHIFRKLTKLLILAIFNCVVISIKKIALAISMFILPLF